MEDLRTELKHITNLLDTAEEHGLEAEVMTEYARSRAAGQSPSEAEAYAKTSWDL